MNGRNDALSNEHGLRSDGETMIAAGNAARRKPLRRETARGDDNV